MFVCVQCVYVLSVCASLCSVCVCVCVCKCVSALQDLIFF